jgi:TolA-binding protein
LILCTVLVSTLDPRLSTFAYAGGEYEEAKLNAGKQARNLAVSQEVEELLRKKEAEVAERRKAGVKLIETYLREHPGTPETAELLFQLAELRWEQSKAEFLDKMAGYNAALERCQKEKETAQQVKEEDKPEGPRLEGKAADKNEAPRARPRNKRNRGAGDRFEPVRCRAPEQPQLDLTSSQAVYRRILEEHPRFPKTDAVLYLYGFSLRSEGRADEALVQWKRILAEFPRSRFRPDAWMAVAEARFYADADYRGALAGYEEVLKYPDSPLYDLALFKTAWCFWKLGDPQKAARRFKDVLDLGQGKTAARADQLTEGGRKRLAELKNEALDYLVQIFTEDESKGAKDAYEFLSSIGGAAYSRKVIDRLATTFYNQARYDRAIEAQRFLIGLDPLDPECPERQKQIALAFREKDDNKQAVTELRKLAETYLDGGEWAKSQSKDAVRKSREMVSTLLRDQAKNLHADAQRVEMYQKRIDLERYGRAAEAYTFYLSKFPEDPAAVEISYLLGDIHFLKTRENEKAGDAYLFVGKSKPVGKLHKDALLNSITAYERVRAEKRPGAAAGQAMGKQELLPTDKKMGEAIDLYASLFPADPEIAGILYKNGELFYLAGDYDEAIKRFGLIVEKYPKNPAAQDAGNKILESLNKAKDYENVESWARRLLKVQAFQDRGSQERLGKLVIDAGMKAGEQKSEKDPIGAATIYLRVQNEFPSSPRASQALANAATLYNRAGKPEESVKIYGKIIDKYPSSSEAAPAAWSAGKLYEASVQWAEAAKYYTILADKYPKDAHAADALYNAGILKEHLGDTQGAIAAYGEYARRHKEREDARKVAFRIGAVIADSGQHEGAARAFADFVRQYPAGPDTVEALERQGEELIKAGQERRAEDPLKRCIAMYKKSPTKGGPATNAAAHARYLEGEAIFRDFERVQLAKDARRLKKTLDEKSALLEKAKAAFIDVVTFNDPEWATAALYRIGEGYERFSKALREAPIPPGLDEQSQQVYREELEKVVVVVEEKAIDSYKNGYKKALDLNVYNEFTQKLRQALGRLSDQEYPAENEARARPASVDRGLSIGFLGSMDR